MLSGSSKTLRRIYSLFRLRTLTLEFISATASGPSGTTYTPSGATIIDIEQNNKVLTSVTTSGSTITIKYV